MASVDDLALFNGTEEEYDRLLEEEVATGSITQEVADALFSAFVEKQKAVEIPQDKTDKELISDLGTYLNDVENPIPEPSFLEQLQQQELDASIIAAQSGEVMPSHDILINRTLHGRDYPLSGLRDDELLKMATSGDPEALQELAERERLANQSFIESLSNPELHKRAAGSVLKGLNQVALMPEGLGALALSGAEGVTGFDFGSEDALLSYDEKVRAVERAVGIGPELTPTESLMESLTGAAVPGGIFAKGVGIGADFMIDQTVRELTDDVGERYETVFDRVGLTDNEQRPVLGTMAALGAVLLGGAVSARAVDNLTKVRLSREGTRLKSVKEIDQNAPEGLFTAEKASDLTKANIVDEQQALRDIVERHGVPNFEDIDARIELDTHAAARTRVEEAINTGQLTTADASFKSPVAPRVLFDAYNSLNKNTRQNVGRYINLKDMRDDIVLAIEKGEATNADLLNIDTQLQNIVKITPEAEEFSKRYNTVTKALRDFSQGSLFSPEYKVRLDQTRANYVPLELTNVDPEAGLLQRMYQAQTKGGKADNEWFLQNRESAGQYDINRRADPMDMLMQSVEATLTARMKNDTKVAIIDALQNSAVNQKLLGENNYIIKRVKSDEATDNADRLIRIYRNGEKETYITSKLTAQLLQFDPYIAKYPALFVPKRIFEQAAVGPLSVTFAPVTMLRDAIGGRVTAPTDIMAPNLLDVGAAIPQQLWAKSLGAISNHFQQSFVTGDASLPSWLMTEAAQKRFSDNVAQAYTQTLYHQANSAGGFDASLMKERIRIGNGALDELQKTLTSSDVTLPGVAFSKARIANMINGWRALFNTIQDAPRFAAIAKNTKKGMDTAEATRFARQLTGDVTKSGRVFDSAGFQMGVDAVDQGLLNTANKGIGLATELLRESTPFFNPMIQGNRRLLQAMIDDPVGFNVKAWQNIGLPSLAAFGWNEMLGKEYNDYAMNERSARDVVMNMYIGLPGKPPQEGLEIPIMHELLTYSAPFTRAMYGLSRGEDAERVRAAMSVVAENILGNSVEIGYPVAGQAVANISGYSAPESLLSPTEGVYKIREDNIGILPENMEFLARTLFASIGDTAINTANAVAGDPSFETFYQELRDRTFDSMPIAKNLIGLKKANTYFSVPNSLAEDRFETIQQFREYYDAFYEPKRFNKDDLQKPNSGNDYTKFKDVENPLEEEDLPFLMIGPEKLQEPTNPFFKEFGPIIVDNLFRGNEGMTALLSRERVYSNYLRRLKDFNNGDADALNEWQAMLNGIEAVDENTKELQQLIEEGGYSLVDYDERIRLINEIEHRRAEIINSQLDTFDRVEDQITAILRERGDLGPDEEFKIMKHLDPFDQAPLQ